MSFDLCWRQDYCASKFAAVGFHESLAHELLAEEVEGVKTTLVCPYIVDTGMFEGCKIRYVNKTLAYCYCYFQSHPITKLYSLYITKSGKSTSIKMLKYDTGIFCSYSKLNPCLLLYSKLQHRNKGVSTWVGILLELLLMFVS